VVTTGSSYHQSVACFGDQLLLVNSQGLRVVQLLSWQQRLSALASQQGQLAAALLAAVRIYQAAASGGSGQVRQQGPGAAAWPADGSGAAPAEVQRQLLTILCAYVDQRLARVQHALPTEAAEEPSSQAPTGAQLADTAIGCCLLLRRPDALWSDLFPRFQAAAQGGSGSGSGSGSGGPEAAFLHQLLPFILFDQLPSVAPEVMQALVEQCVAGGAAEAVEQCVLRMDILSLDLNQASGVGRLTGLAQQNAGQC
jgi:peptidoglycan hydrolase-like protein with peptidoglycan-binding domain